MIDQLVRLFNGFLYWQKMMHQNSRIPERVWVCVFAERFGQPQRAKEMA
jgi:hypothetical protein